MPTRLGQGSHILHEYGDNFASIYPVVAGGVVLLASGETFISTLKAPGQLAYAIVYNLERADRDIRQALAA